MSWKPDKGEVIANRYRLDREIARGGMGSVWAGNDNKLKRPVAVKLVAPDWDAAADAQERFEHEAMAVAQLQSPHVVQIFDYGVERGCPYIVMELLEGEDLRTRLHRLKRVSLETAGQILVQTAKALSVAHAAGIIHRDLKPGNIFLVRQGEEELVKVLDFGVAARAQDLLEADSDTPVLGTPQFMSPEQARGLPDLDQRADLWSLGVIIYKALTGHLPFNGTDPTEVIVLVCTTDADPICKLAPDLPHECDAFFLKALARDRDKRFRTAREMAMAFSRICPINYTTLSMPDPKMIEAAIAAAKAPPSEPGDDDARTMSIDAATRLVDDKAIEHLKTTVHIPSSIVSLAELEAPASSSAAASSSVGDEALTPAVADVLDDDDPFAGLGPKRPPVIDDALAETPSVLSTSLDVVAKPSPPGESAPGATKSRPAMPFLPTPSVRGGPPPPSSAGSKPRRLELAPSDPGLNADELTPAEIDVEMGPEDLASDPGKPFDPRISDEALTTALPARAALIAATKWEDETLPGWKEDETTPGPRRTSTPTLEGRAFEGPDEDAESRRGRPIVLVLAAVLVGVCVAAIGSAMRDEETIRYEVPATPAAAQASPSDALGDAATIGDGAEDDGTDAADEGAASEGDDAPEKPTEKPTAKPSGKPAAKPTVKPPKPAGKPGPKPAAPKPAPAPEPVVVAPKPAPAPVAVPKPAPPAPPKPAPTDDPFADRL